MLNQWLYNRLVEIFGNVTVEQAGIKPRLAPGIKAAVKLQRGYYGETYKTRCPICDDHSQHCYISSLSFSESPRGQIPLMAHCFRRDCFKQPGALQKFTAMLLGDLKIPELHVECSEEETSFSTASTVSTCDLTLENIKKWSPDYHTFEEAPQEVLDYVAQRDLTAEDLARLHIGWGKCWNYKKQRYVNDNNWLIFPIYDQMGLRGIQSRQLIDTKMKYFFDPRTPKQMCLYNREAASRFPVVCIAEGVVDAIHIGKPGMAYFGVKPSTAQKKLIQQDGAQMVLWCPDQKKHYTNGVCDLDPPQIARDIADEWQQTAQFPLGIHIIDLPGDDAGSLPRATIWQTIVQQLKNKLPDAGKVMLKEVIKETL